MMLVSKVTRALHQEEGLQGTRALHQEEDEDDAGL